MGWLLVHIPLELDGGLVKLSLVGGVQLVGACLFGTGTAFLKIKIIYLSNIGDIGGVLVTSDTHLNKHSRHVLIQKPYLVCTPHLRDERTRSSPHISAGLLIRGFWEQAYRFQLGSRLSSSALS